MFNSYVTLPEGIITVDASTVGYVMGISINHIKLAVFGKSSGSHGKIPWMKPSMPWMNDIE